jgi:hypothetical protein
MCRGRNNQDLWIGVSRGVLFTSWFVGSLDEFAVLEAGAGSNQGDEVGCVDGAPPGLCGLDELECHRDPGCA